MSDRFYCPSCDKKRSRVRGEDCNGCLLERQEEKASKPFKPKFADIYKKPNCDAAGLIVSWLDGSDHERGRLEEAQAQATNVTEAFGRLIQVLFENNVLSKEEVGTVAGAYEYLAEEEE